MDDTLYTIGHSNKPDTELVELLKLARVNCVLDVRSVPASKYNPQFNKEIIAYTLRKNKIWYGYFGDHFGARRTDCIVDGQVNFEKAVETDAFKSGVIRIDNALKQGFRIAFMCSEADPLACHRFSMVSRYFYDNGYKVFHILHSREIIDHETLERKMIEGYVVSHQLQEVSSSTIWGDMEGFKYTSSEQRIDAYRLKNLEIGYKTGEEYENLD